MSKRCFRLREVGLLLPGTHGVTASWDVGAAGLANSRAPGSGCCPSKPRVQSEEALLTSQVRKAKQPGKGRLPLLPQVQKVVWLLAVAGWVSDTEKVP